MKINKEVKISKYLISRYLTLISVLAFIISYIMLWKFRDNEILLKYFIFFIVFFLLLASVSSAFLIHYSYLKYGETYNKSFTIEVYKKIMEAHKKSKESKKSKSFIKNSRR